MTLSYPDQDNAKYMYVKIALNNFFNVFTDNFKIRPLTSIIISMQFAVFASAFIFEIYQKFFTSNQATTVCAFHIANGVFAVSASPSNIEPRLMRLSSSLFPICEE